MKQALIRQLLLLAGFAQIATSALSGQASQIRFQSVARIPRGEETAATSFYLTTAVTMTQDGLIYTLDRFNNSVRVFDQNARLLREFGRKGSGPGELLEPTQMSLSPSRVYVSDRKTKRLTWFSHSGRYEGDLAYPDRGRGTYAHRVFALRNGLMLVEFRRSLGAVPGTASEGRTQIVLYDTIGRELQVIGEYPDGVGFGFVRGSPGFTIPTGEPTGPGGLVAVSGDSLLAVINSYRGIVQYYTVEKSRARLLRSRDLGLTPRRASLSRDEQQRSKEYVAQGLRSIPAQIELYYPEFIAQFEAALFASNGDLWLRRWPLVRPKSDIQHNWLVVPFDARRAPFDVQFPKNFVLESITGAMLVGVQLDADRVESVAVLRIAGASSTRRPPRAEHNPDALRITDPVKLTR